MKKKYTGILAKRREHPGFALSEDVRKEILAKILSEDLDLISDLFGHYQIEYTDITDNIALLSLVRALARDHVPAFKFKKRKGPDFFEKHARLIALVAEKKANGLSQVTKATASLVGDHRLLAWADADAEELRQKYYESRQYMRGVWNLDSTDSSRDQGIEKICLYASLYDQMQ